MKNSDKRRGKGESGDESRKRFLQILGAGTIGAGTLDIAFISQAFGASSMVEELPHSETQAHLQVAASKSLHPEMVPQLEAALSKLGLHRVDSIARVYKFTSAAGVTKHITIIPFHPEGKAPGKLAEIVGSIGLSEGSSPSSVSVKLEGTKIVSFTTHDVLFGKLVQKTITPEELRSAGTGAFVEKSLPREHVTPDVSVMQSEGLSESTLRTLLADEEKAGQYTPAQVQGFLTNLPSIRLMAQLQYTRHKGLTMSPGNACCSCCSCCWGCCSCTSAVSSSYLSERYRSRSSARRLSA
jgi:hypothetical protein